MANMKSKDVWYRIAKQQDRTTTPSGTTPYDYVDVQVPADGVDFISDFSTEDLDTDHGAPGVLFTIMSARNLEKKKFRTYMIPTCIGTFLNGVVSRSSSTGELDYFGVERWWGSALGGSEDKGQRFLGFLMDTFSLTIDRSGKSDALMLDVDGYINQSVRILTGASTPSKDWSKATPYQSTGALIDFVRDVTVDSYGADDQDVRRVTLSYQNGLTVEGLQDNDTTVGLDKVWTVQAPGEQRCSVEVQVRVTQDEYLTLDAAQSPVVGALRIALTHPKGTKVTTTSTLTVGDNNDQTLLVASTTGFQVGDVCVITHPTTGFSTLPIKTVNAGVSLVYDTDTGGGTGKDSRVTLNGASGGPLTIRNMGVGIIIDAMTFKGGTPPTREGNFRVVTLRYEAKLAAGASRIIEVHAYNHANSRIS